MLLGSLYAAVYSQIGRRAVMSGAVILYQSFHRSLHDAAKVHAFVLKSLFERLTKYLGYRPVETDRQLIPSVVLLFKLSDESKRYPVRQPDIPKKSPNRLNLHACP